MDDLSDLELLGLVNKVVSELQNHLGVSDKTLAYFIIAQRLDSNSFERFKQKINDLDADFPHSLIESVDRLIQIMHPAMRAKPTARHDQSSNQQSMDEKAQIFSGLALPNKAPAEDSDVMLNVFEALEQQNRQNKTPLRTYAPNRSRSRSPEAWDQGSRSDYVDRERRKSRRTGGQEPDRRDTHGHRLSRHHGHRNRDHLSEEHHESRRACDDSPVLHKVYDGHVTGVKDFGAFVNLHDVMGTVDGLVHVSQLKMDESITHQT
ncbi:hypothetical protein BDV06DRAFT_229589 [Aspergillus oleicola]